MKTSKLGKPRLTDDSRESKMARLKKLLSSKQKFTPQEFAQLRGRLGGLSGAGSPGRSLGGRKGALSRWSKEKK
jgi:hypothetical protein